MHEQLFSLVAEDRLHELLENLYKFTELPIRLLDADGSILMCFGAFPPYCAKLQGAVFTEQDCAAVHAKAGKQALALGEAYIFPCHANLNHIAFPLIGGKALMGTILMGPFLLDAPDSTVLIGLTERYAVDLSLSLELYDCLADVPVLRPAKVNNLKVLLDYLLSSLIPGERAILLLRQQQLSQQSRINESIQTYKEERSTTDLRFCYEKEKELLSVVKSGDVQSAKRVLNELIGDALFNGGGVIETVRPRSVELTTLLSRVAMDGGASPERIYALSGRFIARLSQENDLEALCMTLQEVVESFMNAAFYEKDKGNPHIRKALQYIAANYSRNMTLQMVADHVGLSPSYFSALFSGTLGVSFKDYLNAVRVEGSKPLLLSTEYSLADIAVAMGFPDQSYFCKVFKKSTGISPGKYRSRQ